MLCVRLFPGLITLVVCLVSLPAHAAAPHWSESKRPLVIAHRGASGYLPEHTLPAIAYAHASHADYVEPDVVLSRDGEPIVVHDIYLDATTNVAEVFPGRSRADGRYYALDFTLAEIKTLRAHERLMPDRSAPVFPGRFPDLRRLSLRILSLDEYLDFVQGLNFSSGREVGIHLEIKEPAIHHQAGYDITAVVLKTLAAHQYLSPTAPLYIQCFDADELRSIRRHAKVPLKLIQLMDHTTFGGLPDDASLASIAQYADGIGPALHQLFRASSAAHKRTATRLITQAHHHGLAVHAYTARRDSLPGSFEHFEELISWLATQGVDAIFTDFPDLTLAILTAAGGPTQHSVFPVR